MDTQSHNEPPKNDLLNMLDNDEFDLSFKPITSGLGFKKQESEKDIIKAKAMNRLREKTQKQLNIPKTEVNRGTLTPFYEDTAKKPLPIMESSLSEPAPAPEINLSEQIEKKEVVYNQADMAFRFVANLIDLVIVFAITCLTLVALVFIAKLTLHQLSELKSLWEIKVYIGVLFLSYYVFYFTFMDTTKSSSIGKSIVNISVRTTDDLRANVIRTFFRAVISLVSYGLLGIPFIINANDKLSGTKVIENEAN